MKIMWTIVVIFFLAVAVFFNILIGAWTQRHLHSDRLADYFWPKASQAMEYLLTWQNQGPAPIRETVKKPVRRAGLPEFDLQAKSGLAWDLDYDFYLFAKNADEPLPIASLTKLLSALVFLDNNPGWNEYYTIQASDKREGNKLNFFPGEKVLVRDLFYSALVASDNSAVISLVGASGLSEADFVVKMNEKAKSLGMTKASFTDPTGLKDSNQASARDVARLVKAAMTDLDIRRAVKADKYELVINKAGKEESRIIKNTDQLLRNENLPVQMIGGKTGYLASAGYCFAGNFMKDKHEFVTVVLGAADQTARFSETERLLKWIVDSHDWPK